MTLIKESSLTTQNKNVLQDVLTDTRDPKKNNEDPNTDSIVIQYSFFPDYLVQINLITGPSRM